MGDGSSGRMPLYALWMLEACLREQPEGGGGGHGADGERSVVERFVRCGGIDQVLPVAFYR